MTIKVTTKKAKYYSQDQSKILEYQPLEQHRHPENQFSLSLYLPLVVESPHIFPWKWHFNSRCQEFEEDNKNIDLDKNWFEKQKKKICTSAGIAHIICGTLLTAGKEGKCQKGFPRERESSMTLTMTLTGCELQESGAELPCNWIIQPGSCYIEWQQVLLCSLYCAASFMCLLPAKCKKMFVRSI